MGFPIAKPVLFAVMLVLDEPSGELLATSTGAVPVTGERLARSLMARQPASADDQASWMLEAIHEHAPDLEPASRLQPLLPRIGSAGLIAIPVWGVGRPRGGMRARHLPRVEPLERVLAAVGREMGDRSFARQALTAIRRSLGTDAFLQRLVGDSLRLRAVATEELQGSQQPELPAVVGLLPPVFSINELQHAIRAALGLTEDEMESGSNFRRRVQEFVTLGVLHERDEDADARSAPDRVGRPPRRYTFDADAWRAWLARRSLARGPGRESGGPAVAHARELPWHVLASLGSPLEATGSLDPAQQAAERRRAGKSGEAMRQESRRIPGDLSRNSMVETETDRLARLEELVASLASQLARNRSQGR